MKKLFGLLAVVIGVLLTSTTAHAQERHLSWKAGSESSVRAVLLREKCDPAWESKVLLDSGIPASERNNLRPQTQVRLWAPSCHLPAPAWVARASAALSTQRSPAPRKARVPSARPTPKPNPLVVTTGTGSKEESLALIERYKSAISDLRSTNSDQFEQITTLNNDVLRLNAEIANRFTMGFVLLIWLSGLLAGLMIGFLVASSRARRRERDRVSYDKVITLEREGVRYPFDFVDAREVDGVRMPTYRCARCSEMVTSLEPHALYRHAGDCPMGKVSTQRY